MKIRPSSLSVGAVLISILALPLWAASPTSGTLSAGSTSAITWNGTAPGGASPEAESTCVEGINCDTFQLTFSGDAADWQGKSARVSLSWLLPATDYDLYVRNPGGQLVGSSAQGVTTSESVDINVAVNGTGTYTVRAVYWAAVGDQYTGRAEVVTAMVDNPPPPSPEPTPAYVNFGAPAGIGQGAGEPTLGTNWNSGNVMFIAGLETLRVNGFDNATGTATWVERSALNTSVISFDPILFTDRQTGRTFVSQLLPTKISLMSFTDDDGETWTPSQGAGINSGVDHQTLGGGPFKAGVLGRGPITAYPHAVYYASQDIGLAEIALSRDGGMTFEVAVPMWNLTQCGGLHGHIKVAPDGTVYVPNKNCGGQQAVAVSEDNGLTWSIRRVPGSTPGDTDPSVGIASDGTVYFGFINTDGSARVAVSGDRGLSWSNPANVGHIESLNNGVFPAVVAGDPNRAAMFWLGTTTAGANGVATDMAFPGTWYGFIATTYDGGKSWVTVKATGTDPAQRGVVCTHGTTCPSGTRNLLDFNDLEMDATGRPVAAFADGCVTADCRNGVDRDGPNNTPDGKVDSYDNDGAEVATIIRQSGGKTLLSAYDQPNAPSSLVASPAKGKVTLSWSDNATNETAYVVERSTSQTSGFAQVASATGSSYTDGAVARKTTYYYRVKAVNANGASSYSNVVSAYVK